MSDLQSIINIHKNVAANLPQGSLGHGHLEAVTGKMKTDAGLDRAALQAHLSEFPFAGGWIQYQGHVVRPQDFVFADGIPIEHPEWGVLLDAELFSIADTPASLAIRFDGEYWQASQWQPGEGEAWLAESLEYRGLGGTRQTYLRLWQDDKNRELRPAAAWLVGNHELGKKGN